MFLHTLNVQFINLLVIKYGEVFHLGEPWQRLEKIHHIAKCQVNKVADVKLCTSSDLRPWGGRWGGISL